MINLKNAKRFCKEDIILIENYTKAINDNTQTWHCHHKNEIELHKTAQELMDMGLYYNRPACELVFLTNSEHAILHGKNMPDEIKAKISKSLKGKHPSSETRAKLSNAVKAHMASSEVRAKLSNAVKAKLALPEVRAKLSKGQKGKHHSDEHKSKISKALKGKVRPKYRWLTPDSSIVIMDKCAAVRFHPDWQLLSNIPVVDPNEKV